MQLGKTTVYFGNTVTFRPGDCAMFYCMQRRDINITQLFRNSSAPKAIGLLWFHYVALLGNCFRFRSVVHRFYPRGVSRDRRDDSAPCRPSCVSISCDKFTCNPCLFAELSLPSVAHGIPPTVHLSTNEHIIVRSGVLHWDEIGRVGSPTSIHPEWSYGVCSIR